MNKPSLSKKVKTATGKISYRQGVFLAILFACLVGGAIIFTGGEDKKPQQQAKQNVVPVIVAKQDIPAHTIIRESMLKNVDVDAGIKPAGAVENAKDIVGKPTNVTIMSGDVITKSKVLIDPKMAGFVGMIPNDCRAISVPITDITGVGGFAKPGDHVDVMVINGKGNENITGELLFQDVLLLAMNKNGTQVTNNPAPAEEKKDGNAEGGEKKDGDKDKDKKKDANQSGTNAPKEAMAIATLALTPEEALKLAVNSREGTVYLSLRPIRPSETFTLATEYFKAGTKAQTTAPAPASAAPSTGSAPAPYYPPVQASVAAPAAPPVQGSNVTVYRGTAKTVE